MLYKVELKLRKYELTIRSNNKSKFSKITQVINERGFGYEGGWVVINHKHYHRMHSSGRNRISSKLLVTVNIP